MLGRVFKVLSVMFAITSLLFCCFCIRLFVSNYVCVVPYGVMRNLDAIIRVSSYVRLNPGLQRARILIARNQFFIVLKLCITQL